MAVIETWFNQDLNSPVRVNVLQGNVFSTDNYGNVVGIKTYRNGAAASLSGSVSATVVRPDGATVAIVGTLSGNQASVALPYAACAVPGLITICIKNTSGSTVTTLGLIVATVYKTSTDTTLDPGTIIPSVEALISQIEEAVDSIPADYSGLWATIAEPYSTEATYKVGKYCTRSGHLYRCVTAIPTAESWTSGHWKQVDFGSEMVDTRTEIGGKFGDTQPTYYPGSMNTSTGVITYNDSTTTRRVTRLIRRGLFRYVAATSPAYQFYVGYFDENQTFVKAVGWKTDSYELENYPYIAILLKIGSAGTDAFTTDDIPVYLSQASAVPSVAAVADTVESIEDLLCTRTAYIRRASVSANGSYANTKRWFLDLRIPAGTYVENFQFFRPTQQQASALTVELWRIEGDNLVKFASVDYTDFVAASVNTVPINQYCTAPTMVGFLCTSAVNYTQGAGVRIKCANDTDPDTDTLAVNAVTDYGDFSPNVTVNTISARASGGGGLPYNVVTVGEGGDYPQIQDALHGIADDSATNPYTILLLPSGTPYERFSMLRDFPDTYPWSGIAPRYISIIGLDRAHCVIRSDSGDYKFPCGEPMTNGIIKNIRFVMTNDQQTEAAGQGGYCLHIDSRTADDVGYNMVIEDCDFENASGPCLGIGMHANCTLTIRRCSLHTTLAASYNPHADYKNLANYGALFCHTSTRVNQPAQVFRLEDCTLISEEGSNSIVISKAGDYDPANSSFVYRLIRNICWNAGQETPGYSISEILTPDPINFGNNND